MTGRIAEASRRYFRDVAKMGRDKGFVLTDDFVAHVEKLRREVREEEGGGGMCHIVSELLQCEFGWPMLSVAYLSEDGRVVCAGHVVNILPDGSVLDGTRDQMGEGHSVSLVPVGSDEIGRYRPEFYEDFHPGHPDDTDGYMTPWLEGWSGMLDADAQDHEQATSGFGWWLEDKSLLVSYCEEWMPERLPANASPDRP